jgi:hypothetical protein
MKTIQLILLLVCLTFVTATAQTEVRVTDTSINAGETVNWTAGNIYMLDGMVFVESGATLTIEAGTVIKAEDGSGNNASGLVICQGGKIYAEGTAEKPIIFTAKLDDLSGMLDYTVRGEWGGVIILGNAPTNNATIRQVEGINEIVGAGDVRANYGGDNADDNSGVFRFVSIRHTGKAVGDQAGNEIQGLTLGGVGRGTKIEYVESFASADDGFEFFGGTVDMKYMVSAFAADDGFDWDEGFNGRGQFWFVIQGEDEAGRMAEMDGAIGDEQANPYAKPMVANVTYLGDGKDNPGQVSGDGSQGLIFRDNSGGMYFNSIFGDFKGQPNASAITIEDVSTVTSEDSRKRLEAGDLKLDNNIWFNFSAGNALDQLINQEFVRTSQYLIDNSIVDPLLLGISREQDGQLDPRLGEGSPAKSGAKASLYTDDWFTKVDYMGAFDSQNWLASWTALAQLDYVTTNGDEFQTSIGDELNKQPKSIALAQNFPNPFNPSTQISFSLNRSTEVTLSVYDINGRLVSTLAQNKGFAAGTHAVQFDASNLASGVYMYQLKTNAAIITKLMTLIK